MQRCPKCNRTYQDDTQKFCTHDGGRLTLYTEPPAGLGDAPTTFDLGATLRTDSSDLGEAALNAAAELNRTMAAPPPPPLPQNKPAAAAAPPPPPLNKTVAAPPPASPPSTAQPSPPQNKTIAAPPPSTASPSSTASQTSELRPTSTMPGYSPTTEIPRAQGTTAFPPSPRERPQTLPSWPSTQPQASLPPGGQVMPPARKSSRMPLILGSVVLLLLLVIGVSAALYFVLNKPKPTSNGPNPGLGSNVSTDAKDNKNANDNKANSSSNTFEAPPNSAKFTNSRANLDGKLAEHYIDFSFYYPRLWTLDPKAGVPGASNFVKIDRVVPPDFSQERFAIGWYDSKGTIQSDRPSFPNLVQKFNDNLSKSFPEYEKVSEGDTKINSYDGYEFRFKSVAKGTDRGDITYWGRVVFLPPGTEGKESGLVLLMFTTSAAADLKSVDDIGKKGELPMVLDTFRLGSNP